MTEATQQAQEAPAAAAAAPTAAEARTAAKFQRNLAVQFEESVAQSKTGATVAKATANLIERQQAEIERLKAELAAATAGQAQSAETKAEGTVTVKVKDIKMVTNVLDRAYDKLAQDKSVKYATSAPALNSIDAAADLLRRMAKGSAPAATKAAAPAAVVTQRKPIDLDAFLA